MIFATEIEAKAAYEQWVSEPHPEGFKETYPLWGELADGHRQLWFRIATAVLNRSIIK